MKATLKVLATALGTVGCAQHLPADCATSDYDSFYGVWESSYGHLFFTYRTSQAPVEADEGRVGIRAAFWSYPDSWGRADNGRIIGSVEGRDLQGYWVQDSGSRRCESEKDGSPYWGRVFFQANDDFTEITGTWSLCDDEPSGDDSGWVLWRDEIRDWEETRSWNEVRGRREADSAN